MNFIRHNIDKITYALAVFVGIMVVGSIHLIFNYAPVEKFMGYPQKIFYFHVPLAISCYIGFFICFAGSAMYLWKKDLMWDRLAVSGAEVGVLATTLVLVTGMLWGKPIWGAYWTWDPRLTTSFILWLIFVGYLVLRTRVDDEVMRAKYAAVMGVVGFADVPLVHFSVKLWSRGIHPVLESSVGDPGMTKEMFTAFKASSIAIVFLFILVFIIRARYEFLKAEVAQIKSIRG